MKILITGANGQLGRELRTQIEQQQLTHHHYIYSNITSDNQADCLPLDITDLAQVRKVVEEQGVKLIINCAAYTNVDKAESDIAACQAINHHAVRNLAVVMREKAGFLLHISTDYVFGGEMHNTPCGEQEKANPLGVYGRTKWEGEEAIRHSTCAHLILRTAWLYSTYGHNFLKTMLRLTAEKPVLRVVVDQCGTPTYARDLAAAIFHIVENDLHRGNEGTYHYSNEGVCSWYDFAVQIARNAGHCDCVLLPCRSAEYPTPVARPAYSVLDKTKFKTTFGLSIPHWTDSLVRCMGLMGEEHTPTLHCSKAP